MFAAKFLTARTALAMLAACASFASAGEANARRALDYQDGMTIEAVSRHGNGSQLGVVRSARYGWEVRLPRGTWVSCRRSCEETLRVETVDLFETEDALTGYGSAAHECGVFGCLEIRYPR
ncbi:MAG: hypothetical protein ACT4OU_07580 [Hyphomicrobium sp.]